MLYYNDGLTDHFMQHNSSYPRYAGIARKIIKNYLGDLYNPETFSYETEYMIRQMIKGYVTLKIFHNQPYDCPVIDHFFRKFLHGEGYTHLNYDQSILDKGYNGVMRGDLPDHNA